MFQPWMLLVICAGSVLSKPTHPNMIGDVDLMNPSTPRRDPTSPVKPSDIYWIRTRRFPNLYTNDDTNAIPTNLYKIKSIRRHRRASPATDSVVDHPTSPWLRKTTPKTNFITGREHRTEKTKQNEEENENSKNLNVKTNEVSFKPRAERINRPEENVRQHAPTRRIIYYANLPEITSKPLDNLSNNQRRYEPLPIRSKYPRESSQEETYARSKPLAVDRYRNRPMGRSNSYTIVDSPLPQSDRQNYANNYQSLDNSKYNKIPAPYHRQNDFYRSPSNYDTSTRKREPSVNSGSSVVRDEPYRDYNPRQPAPWSVQIGTRLTVKDDGRPFRRDDGRLNRQEDGQRRFYVNSQEGPRFNQQEDRTRYRLL